MTRLKPKFTAMGLVLRGVDMGKVDLPPDYRAGMEKLLAEELETEKVRYTLELKEARGQADGSSRPRPTRCGDRRRPRLPARSKSSPRARRRRP